MTITFSMSAMKIIHENVGGRTSMSYDKTVKTTLIDYIEANGVAEAFNKAAVYKHDTIVTIGKKCGDQMENVSISLDAVVAKPDMKRDDIHGLKKLDELIGTLDLETLPAIINSYVKPIFYNRIVAQIRENITKQFLPKYRRKLKTKSVQELNDVFLILPTRPSELLCKIEFIMTQRYRSDELFMAVDGELGKIIIGERYCRIIVNHSLDCLLDEKEAILMIPIIPPDGKPYLLQSLIKVDVSNL